MKYTTYYGLDWLVIDTHFTGYLILINSLHCCVNLGIASLTRVMKCIYWVPHASSNLPTLNITVLEWRAYKLLTSLANCGNKRKRVEFYCDVLTIHKSPKSDLNLTWLPYHLFLKSSSPQNIIPVKIHIRKWLCFFELLQLVGHARRISNIFSRICFEDGVKTYDAYISMSYTYFI